MASLTMFSGLKKNNGDSPDKTPFSAILRAKKEENAKKAKYLKEALSATSPRSPPPMTSTRSNLPDRGAIPEVPRARTRSHEKVNGDESPGSPREVSAPKFIKKMVFVQTLLPEGNEQAGREELVEEQSSMNPQTRKSTGG